MKLVPKEISHPIHPEHKLAFHNTDEPFRCNGCQEPGAGLRFTCTFEACDFDLHKSCALAKPGDTLGHALFKNCEFVFRYMPTHGRTRTICDACGKVVNGFVYHCAKRDLDLHPVCAGLPLRFDHEELTFDLRKEASTACSHCGEKGRFWFYRSECKTVDVHVACVKDMVRQGLETVYLNRNESGGSGGSNGRGSGRQVQTGVPFLEGVLQNYPRRRVGGGFQRFCRIVGGAIRVIVGAILGDPTAIIAAVIGAIFSNR